MDSWTIFDDVWFYLWAGLTALSVWTFIIILIRLSWIRQLDNKKEKEQMNTIRKVFVIVGIYLIRGAVCWLGSIWPKSHRYQAFEVFELLDKYYGHPVDPEDRVSLLMQVSTEEERLIIYKDVFDRVMMTDRLNQVVNA